MPRSEEVEVEIACDICDEDDEAKKRSACKRCGGEGGYTVTIDLADSNQIGVPDDICALLWRRGALSTSEMSSFSMSDLFDIVRRIERDSP